MIEDEKLQIDEFDRVQEHQVVKDQVRQDLHADITRQAQQSGGHHEKEAAAIGGHLRDKAVSEIWNTETEIERGRGAARISQVIDYIFYLIYSVIALEILLELLGAREGNGFKRFMDAITLPLLGPFNTLMPDMSSGRFQLKLSYFLALFVYILLHMAINGFLRLMAHRKTTV